MKERIKPEFASHNLPITMSVEKVLDNAGRKRPDMYEEMCIWCKTNCKGLWLVGWSDYGDTRASFSSTTDAVGFKLRWI